MSSSVTGLPPGALSAPPSTVNPALASFCFALSTSTANFADLYSGARNESPAGNGMPVGDSSFGNNRASPRTKIASRSITSLIADRSTGLSNGATVLFSHRPWMPRPAGNHSLWFFGSLST